MVVVAVTVVAVVVAVVVVVIVANVNVFAGVITAFDFVMGDSLEGFRC